MRRALIVLFLLGLGLGLAPFDTAAQNPYEQDAIRLKARVFVPKLGLDKGLKPYFKKKAGERTVHVLVQFLAVPSLEERQVLEEEMKVRLLDTVPEHAFFVAMPPDLSLAKRLVGKGKPARWVGLIAPEDKVAPWLLREGVPEHARRPDGMAELIIEFFGDVEVKHQEEILTNHGAKVLTRIEGLNGWQVILDARTLLALAAEDPVKWIVEVPPPPKEANDGVRSKSGVNADAVLPPNVYNLTGNGVVVGEWDSGPPSLTHGDFAGRIALGDPWVPIDKRSWWHTESVAANGMYDNGEAVYADMDDSGNVSAGDVRATALGFDSNVRAGDADEVARLGLVKFQDEYFADIVSPIGHYNVGEGIYRDNDFNGMVTAGDTRLTPVTVDTQQLGVGSVATGDGDLGRPLRQFLNAPHYHATHVAGTVIGSGAMSDATATDGTRNGGAPNQWKGVAPGAFLRTYGGGWTNYGRAATHGVTISTNSWFSGFFCDQAFPPNICYDVPEQFYDALISGRQSDGTPSGLAQRVLVLFAAGNMDPAGGGPERHTDNVTGDGQYNAGESIYRDLDDDGVVSTGDAPILGTAQAVGTHLMNFNLNERHSDGGPSIGLGYYDSGEGIYRDADSTRTVSVGDERIIATAGTGLPTGPVRMGDADVGTFLRQFKLWGNLAIPGSAKDTIVVANIYSDTKTLFPSSSRGPTDDGRVKPDLAGPGSQSGGDRGVTSTFPGNKYVVSWGTSMATPAVAGSAALLTEWYKTACVPGGPTPDALRALLIHGAEDLTTIPNVGMAGGFAGPDFAFGYGRTRVKEAVDLLPHHRQGTITAVGVPNDYQVTIGAMQTLKVTLVWDDPAWTANAMPSAATGILQNDLDLLLIAPDGTQYAPWVLNGANPFTPATRSSIPAGSPVPPTARDRRNTIEQIVVDNAMAGTWTIRVTASMLNWPPQSYTLVSEALPPQAGPCASTPSANVWMQDNASDTMGSVPSSGDVWLSPDIWNRYAPDGLTAHENPEFGQVNYIYANIRNDSVASVKATSIDVWLAPASTGLVWPDIFTYVGRISVPNLSPGEVRQVGALPWNPPPPSPSDHFCFYVRVTSPQDPIMLAETTDVDFNARYSNNIVWRNINVVDLRSSQSVTFLVRNVEKKEAEVDLVFKIPEEFLLQGKVLVHFSPELEKRWPEQYRKVEGLRSLEELYRVTREPEELLPPPYQLTAPVVTLKGFRMEPTQAEPVSLTFQSEQRTKAFYEVHVTEHIRDRTVGGILYVVRTSQHE